MTRISRKEWIDARCMVSGCENPPTQEIGGRVLVCDEHAEEYREHAEQDWR